MYYAGLTRPMLEQPSDEDEDQAASHPDSASLRANLSRAHQLAQTFNLAQQQPAQAQQPDEDAGKSEESHITDGEPAAPPHPAFDWSILNASPDRTNTVGIRAHELPYEGQVPVDPPGKYYSHAARFERKGNSRIISRLFAVAAGVILGTFAFMYMPSQIEAALAGALHGTPLSSAPPKAAPPTHHSTPAHHVKAHASTTVVPASVPAATATPEAAIPTLTPSPTPPPSTPAPTAPPVNTAPAPSAAPLACAGGSTYATSCAWYVQLSPVSGTLLTIQPGSGVAYTVSVKTPTGVTFAQGSASAGSPVALKLTSPPPAFLVVVTPQGAGPGTFHLSVTRV